MANLARAPRMAAPASHQCVESLTEILKRLCGGIHQRRGSAIYATADGAGTEHAPAAADHDSVMEREQMEVSSAVDQLSRCSCEGGEESRSVGVCLPKLCLLPQQQWISFW